MTTQPPPDRPRRESFHDHLDHCSQCANNPFQLCAVGAKLIGDAVRKI